MSTVEGHLRAFHKFKSYTNMRDTSSLQSDQEWKVRSGQLAVKWLHTLRAEVLQ